MGWLLLTLMLGLIALRVPVAMAMGVGTLVVLFSLAAEVPLTIVPLMLFDGTNSFVLLAIPLFMIAGELINAADIGRRLIRLASSSVGFMRGGLGMATVVVGMILADISGSSVADAAAMGSVLIPEMKRRGYPTGLAAAILSSASSIAIIIPPSITMVMFGFLTNTSVAQLFAGGFAPGILIGISLMITTSIYARRLQLPIEQKFSAVALVRSFWEAAWALTLPVIIIGGILIGVFTPTEAAGVAVVAALVIGMMAYKTLQCSMIPSLLLRAARQTAIVMFIIATSTIMSWYLSHEQIPDQIAASVLSLTDNKFLILLLINGILLVAGCLLHGAPILIMMVPIMHPIAQSLSLDPVHFGLIFTIAIAIGQQTPPVASVLYVACAIAETSMEEVTRYNKYFILAMIIVLLVVDYVPEITLFLPRMLFR